MSLAEALEVFVVLEMSAMEKPHIGHKILTEASVNSSLGGRFDVVFTMSVLIDGTPVVCVQSASRQSCRGSCGVRQWRPVVLGEDAVMEVDRRIQVRLTIRDREEGKGRSIGLIKVVNTMVTQWHVSS